MTAWLSAREEGTSRDIFDERINALERRIRACMSDGVGGSNRTIPVTPYRDSRERKRVARVLFILGTVRIPTTRLSIKQIAQEVGYTSLVTFGRKFKRVHKMMPSAYRQASRKSVERGSLSRAPS